VKLLEAGASELGNSGDMTLHVVSFFVLLPPFVVALMRRRFIFVIRVIGFLNLAALTCGRVQRG